jgi:thioredoxin 1
MITVLGRLKGKLSLCDFITEKVTPFGYTEEKRKGADPMMIKNLNAEEFEKLRASGEIMLVDFWAPWCGYCRRLNPVYDKIAQQYGDRAVIAKINIDEAPALADKEQIELIPTLVLYRDGQAQGSLVAPQSKALIDDFMKENLGL